jgi:hypothetical protein
MRRSNSKENSGLQVRLKMSQIILVGSYCGLSDYTFEVTVSGRRLNMSELKQLGLVDDDAIRRHKQSNHSCE